LPSVSPIPSARLPICDFKFGNERSTGSYFLEILGGNSPATAGKLPSKRLSQSSPGILFPRILGW
jgi:hypothetical protein